MKVELGAMLPIVALAGGIVFTYVQLTSQVAALEDKLSVVEDYNDAWIRSVTDENMNRIIALEVKMDVAEKLISEYAKSQSGGASSLFGNLNILKGQ